MLEMQPARHPKHTAFLGNHVTSITASCPKSFVRKQHLHFMQPTCCYAAGTDAQSRPECTKHASGLTIAALHIINTEKALC